MTKHYPVESETRIHTLFKEMVQPERKKHLEEKALGAFKTKNEKITKGNISDYLHDGETIKEVIDQLKDGLEDARKKTREKENPEKDDCEEPEESVGMSESEYERSISSIDEAMREDQ